MQTPLYTATVRLQIDRMAKIVESWQMLRLKLQITSSCRPSTSFFGAA